MDTSATTSTSAETHPAPPPRGADRWLFWLIPAALAVTFVMELLCSLPGLLSFILIPVEVLGSPLLALSGIALGILLVLRRRWRSGASIIVSIAVSAVLLQPVRWTVDLVHLGLTVGFGAGELPDTLPPPDDKYHAHDWSVGFAGGPNTFLLYDDTDKLAGPLQRATVPASEQTVEQQCAGRSEHLVAHYYVCSF